MSESLTIFYSKEFPNLLGDSSLILSTYQANKVILISGKPDGSLTLVVKHFLKPMGIAFDGRKLAIACFDRVEVLSNAPRLAKKYPINPDKYDNLFMPRASYYTGALDLHDLAWRDEGLWAVNTRFSCLSMIHDDFGFVPTWQPPFITDLMPEDRCHLNGLAMQNGKPSMVSALGKSNTPEGWRQNRVEGGILIELESGEVILDKLPMPHSPRYVNGKLYFLLSATGELAVANPVEGKWESITELPGLCRGMSPLGDNLFIGISKIREISEGFGQLPIADRATRAGIVGVNHLTGNITGELWFEGPVSEIYDIQVLPGISNPGMVGPGNEVWSQSVHGPGLDFWRKE